MSPADYDRTSRLQIDQFDLSQAVFALTSTLKVAYRVKNDIDDPLYVQNTAESATGLKASVVNVPDKEEKTVFEFEEGTKQFLIRCEKVTEIKYNFDEDEFDAGVKLTITSGGYLKANGLSLPAGYKIFFETDLDNKDIEILQWT